MKRLLFIFSTLNAGGAEKAAILISNYLVEKYSYKIEFYVFDNSSYYKELISNKIKIIQSGYSIPFANKWQWLLYYYLVFGWNLVRRINTEKYTSIIAIHEKVPEVAILFLWLKSWFLGKNIRNKLVTIVQTSQGGSRKFINSLHSRIFNSFLQLMRDIIFATTVVLTHNMKNEVNSKKTHSVVIPNPIDPDILRNYYEKNEINRSTKPFIVFSARIVEQKNPLFLLRVFSKIMDNVKYDLVMIGEIFDKELYNRMIAFIHQQKMSSRVKICGQINNPYEIIKKSSGIVLVSKYEGMPLVLLEAMSLKVPIITVKFEGYDEFLNDRNAMLYTQDSENELANILLSICTEDLYIKERIEQAYKDSKKYEISIIGEKYHKLFSGLNL